MHVISIRLRKLASRHASLFRENLISAAVLEGEEKQSHLDSWSVSSFLDCSELSSM